MKQIGSLLTAGALALSLVTLPAGAAEAAPALEETAQAAAQGAEATKQYVSKFGRAKSYGTKTIGTPDAGAVSMSWFFQGLARE